jgi:hypothetical protein
MRDLFRGTWNYVKGEIILTSYVNAVADENSITRYGYTLHVEVYVENDELYIGFMPSCRI